MLRVTITSVARKGHDVSLKASEIITGEINDKSVISLTAKATYNIIGGDEHLG